MIDDEEDDDVDKSITGFTAIKEDDQKLILTVQFTTPENVSNLMQEPDFLKFEFMLPHLILDAENGESLGIDQLVHQLQIEAQLSK